MWNAARDMVRDGDLAPAAYLPGRPRPPPLRNRPGHRQGVLVFARARLTDHFLPADDRPPRPRDPHRPRPRHPAPHRRPRTRPARGPAPDRRPRPHRQRHHPRRPLQEWLDDGSVPGGPALDPELRWRILGRLAVLGATTPDAIDAELARDPSATGREGAAHCRAALPDPAAKQAAWQALFTTDEDAALSNYLFTATATGFWAPEQHDLLRPYVARYFTDAPALARHRGPALAAAAGRYAFPATFVEDDTLHLGETCLAQSDPTPALRRKLIDQLDDLRRALKVRAVAAHDLPGAG